MAKHLTVPLKKKIVESIKAWQDPVHPEAKITWPIVVTIVRGITGETEDREWRGLAKIPEFKKAYVDKNASSVSEQSAKDKRIERLEKEKKDLQKENDQLCEKFLRWAYNAKNATRVPVMEEDLERPLPNPEKVRNKQHGE